MWLSLSSNQVQAGRVYDLRVYLMRGAPEGSTESSSGEAGNPWALNYNASLELSKT